MEKEQRNRLQKATQDARKLLEEEFRSQLLQTYDIDVEKVRWAEEPGAHLQAEQRLIRDKLVAWIEHKEAQINDRKEALLLALREMAFTALNRFVALKLMEARELVRPSVSGGLESAGFLEFTAVAQGLLADPETSYRLYLETIFEDVSRELRALFDPRDPASLLWPKRAALLELLDILNRPELAELWIEDETLGWVYQYFNGDAERKKMREESSAPRNSRELAVRNQFFTPRYVVEFLTDNTLGRIWYEMRQGNTGQKDRCRYLVRRPNEVWLQPGEEPPSPPDADEALSQEERLQQPVHIPYRPLKDPREIRMLDPACGSMHFGLYAFDLYLEIYKEAWEIAQVSDEQSKQEEAFSPFVAYAAGFADKSAFLREVPKLILQHNIHGIDIDPRATQIARLTLWLRAQRAWKEQHLQVADRSAITRSNVVCAEPMPGERELLADFVDQQFPDAERGLVQQFLEAIFAKMQLAGEAGSLLKIEEEIRDAIDRAQREWQKLAVQQRELFGADELAALGQIGSSLNIDLQSLTKDFWNTIEERIYAALHDYSKLAESGSGIQRRLFTEDAAQGFAFIDLCRKKYDTVLMNPPFGDPTDKVGICLVEFYEESNRDIYSAFVIRGSQLLSPVGGMGAITSRAGFFLSSMEAWRDSQFIRDGSLFALADLGYGVLDAKVETAAYCSFRHSASTHEDRHPAHQRDTLFIGSLEYSNKDDVVLAAIQGLQQGRPSSQSYLLAPIRFRNLPSAPFAYGLPQAVFALFAKSPCFESSTRHIRAGVQTSDDFRFLRAWWEISQRELFQFDGMPDWAAEISDFQAACRLHSTERTWCTFTKGGEYSPYSSEIPLVINWRNEGKEIKAYAETTPGTKHWSRNIRSSDFFFRAGLTYLARTSVRLCASQLPAGSIFSNEAGPGIFVDEDDLRLALGRFNSLLLETLAAISQVRGVEVDTNSPAQESNVGELKVLRYRKKYIVGTLQRLPWPERAVGERNSCIDSVIATVRALRATEETSHDFVLHRKINDQELYIAANSILEVERQVAAAYGIELLQCIRDALGVSTEVDALEKIRDSLLIATPHVDSRHATTGNISYIFGLAYGRWDIRYATGERASPMSPDPFAPMPVCPPGQLQNGQGLPARLEEVEATYPVRIPWNGVLVDDPSHPFDLERCIREVIEIIWSRKEIGPEADAIEHEACKIIGAKSLRDYFRKPAGFFAEHLKRYSKSRRQAPIYWQLSAGNGSYSAWLYYHRFTQDTLYRVLRDFVEPRIQQAEREQFELESQGALSGDAATRLQETQTLLQDLRMFKSELDLVAPLWNPNLNDGVIINHAILWRITPYTPWQKKCKECWDKLVKGDYDWAHLAFNLWPERVIPKCITDRSLAIAHGLEERLWQETNNGNWLPRQLSEADLQALIAEHSNPAVKSALERFLAAPPPVAPTRTRASRSTRASGSSTPRRARGSAAVVDAEATRQVLLALTAAPSDGLAKTQIADLIGVEANALTAVIKQLKEGGQIDQLGERRGARYVLSEQGRAAVAAEAGGEG
jgi:hypothetical protein